MNFKKTAFAALLACTGWTFSAVADPAHPCPSTDHFVVGARVEMCGFLVEEDHWGPPKPGNEGLGDSVERDFYLLLEYPSSFEGGSADQAADSEDAKVMKVQLVSGDQRGIDAMRAHLGSKVVVGGTTFSAQTGHHHTQVLVRIERIARKDPAAE